MANEIIQFNNKAIAKYRQLIQSVVFALVLYSGVVFYFFVEDLEQALPPAFERPTAVDGFLPIGGLMSLKLFVITGIIEPFHPASLVIFGSVVLISFAFRKSFCSWICPVGTFSEALWQIGRRLFHKDFKIHRYIDYPLMSIKYLLLIFFVYVIVIQMTPTAIVAFFNTPYWKVADIKMLLFFTEMSKTTLITLLVLMTLSLLVRNFWCRYLCPYGALIGLFGKYSLTSLKRDSNFCIHCQRCSKHCPGNLYVHEKETVHSAECTGCLTCLSQCPAKNALKLSFLHTTMSAKTYMLAVLITFFGIIAVAKLTGKWESSLTAHELIKLMPFVRTLQHP